MGAEQSSAQGGQEQKAQHDSIRKTCFYEVLGIERDAAEAEIKKAYRRKALELHPDRNYGDVENATARFAEVQTAYEVLSDLQERSWYDSHRESILRGGDEAASDHFEQNVRFTSAQHIASLIGKFNSSVAFNDTPNGFYGILRQTFEGLAREEASACSWDGLDLVDFPGFGGARDDYEDVVKPFYRTWINFSTQKSFSWVESYKPSDAPDRATRRAIEKENKKARDEAKAEFNDAVRHLATFVRKRDPRYVPNTQTEAQRQRIIRDSAAAQAAQARAANRAKLNIHLASDWTTTSNAEEEVRFSESEDSEVEEIECVVCGKTFKSEKQYEAHERSKKHSKAVQQLRKQLKIEEKSLGIEQDSDLSSDIPDISIEKLNLEPDNGLGNRFDIPEEIAAESVSMDDLHSPPQLKTKKERTSFPDSPSDSADDAYAPRKEVEERLTAGPIGLGAKGNFSSPTMDSQGESPKPKAVKSAKAKRAKKMARQEAEAAQQGITCAACNESFTSSSKLHKHIKEMPTHAQPVLNSKGRKR